MSTNMYEIYNLARVAQEKLLVEVSRKSHCLRRLCGHANLYDSLLLDLKTTKQKEARESELFFALHEEKIEEVEKFSTDDLEMEDYGEESEMEDWEGEEELSPDQSEHCNSEPAVPVDAATGYESDESDLDFDTDEEGQWAGWEKEYALSHADFMSAVILAIDHNLKTLEVAPSEVVAPRSLELFETHRQSPEIPRHVCAFGKDCAEGILTNG